MQEYYKLEWLEGGELQDREYEGPGARAAAVEHARWLKRRAACRVVTLVRKRSRDGWRTSATTEVEV